jgi:hypothetical protein
VRAAYGHKYDEAIIEAMEDFKNNVIPELQKQLKAMQQQTSH